MLPANTLLKRCKHPLRIGAPNSFINGAVPIALIDMRAECLKSIVQIIHRWHVPPFSKFSCHRSDVWAWTILQNLKSISVPIAFTKPIGYLIVRAPPVLSTQIDQRNYATVIPIIPGCVDNSIECEVTNSIAHKIAFTVMTSCRELTQLKHLNWYGG